jgi:hypothetical protein
VVDGLAPGQSACPAIKLTLVIIFILCMVIYIIMWELLAIHPTTF